MSAASLLVLIFLLFAYGYKIPVGVRYEYDQAVRGYLTLVKLVPRGSMTLIAPQEQYQEVFGNGFHYQLWEFVKKQTDNTISKINIPTPNIFIFIEKKPLYNEKNINPTDAKLSIPSLTGELIQYYYNPLTRITIESKAYYWVEEFRKMHPNNVSVFYEDDVFMIYWIKQDENEELNLKTALPTEYFQVIK